ncbi:hypothetical protein ASD64_01280 [Mesorhizobium sp. Root157]|uniref:hypothetical protein n=1 Tax=Mesorhizobium sp. Root157 TaxID=1736477 RepID=UPI0006F25853|nr:hypothetical protein [Mesorhizobium sp. Root157]KRA00235.1 hypothetical protein ASD64_01280 [Mesorhizobium sp. Root157]
MGGSSKKATPAAAATPLTASDRPTTTVPASMPGQLDALSAQLAAGFGQSQPDILALLNQYYQPMQLPDYSQPFTTGKPAAATPAAATPAGTHVNKGGIRLDREHSGRD